VARVELGVRTAYHAADVAALNGATLASLDPAKLETSQFELAPAVTLVRSPYPVGSIWLANMEGGPAPGSGAEDVVISRPEFDPFVDVAPAGSIEFLTALDRGVRFGDAANTVTAPDFDLGATLTLCLTRGLLILTTHDH